MNGLKKFFLVIVLMHFCSIKAQVGIGTIEPHVSAIVEVKSEDKGLLPPRISDPYNDISTPAEGLMIYNTTENCLQVNNGTPAAPVWECLGSNSGGPSTSEESLSFPWETDLRFKSVRNYYLIDDNNDYGSIVRNVSAGISTDDDLFVWGSDFGDFVRYVNTNSTFSNSLTSYGSPIKLNSPLINGKVGKIAVGDPNFSISTTQPVPISMLNILTTDNKIYQSSGITTNSQLQLKTFPTGVTPVQDMLDINSGGLLIIIGNDGNIYREIGTTNTYFTYPKPSGVGSNFKYKKFLGRSFGLWVLGSDNKVYVHADQSNNNFQYGTGGDLNQGPGVYKVNFPSGSGIIKKISGALTERGKTMFAVSENGKMYGWGARTAVNSPTNPNASVLYSYFNSNANYSDFIGVSTWGVKYQRTPKRVNLPSGENGVIDTEQGYFLTNTGKVFGITPFLSSIYFENDFSETYHQLYHTPEGVVSLENSFTSFNWTGNALSLWFLQSSGRITSIGETVQDGIGNNPSNTNASQRTRVLPLPLMNGNLDSENYIPQTVN